MAPCVAGGMIYEKSSGEWNIYGPTKCGGGGSPDKSREILTRTIVRSWWDFPLLVAVYCRFVCLHLLCDQNVWSLWESWAGLSMFLSSYIYIYTQTRNNFRKEILRNDKFINFGKWYSYQKRKLYPFFDLNLNCFYFNATKIFESFLSFSLFLFYTINSDFKLYVEFRSEKVSVHSFHSFNIFFFSNYIVNQGVLSRFHEDVEISGGNLSDKYEYVTVSKVWTLPHSCDWRLICTS